MSFTSRPGIFGHNMADYFSFNFSPLEPERFWVAALPNGCVGIGRAT
jgi:hypothetical protein